MNYLVDPRTVGVLLLAVTLYWKVFTTRRARIYFLLLASIASLLYVQPRFTALFLGIAGANYGLLLVWKHVKHYRIALPIVVLALIIFLCLMKRDWTVDTPSKVFLIPLGVSYFVFRMLQVVLDHHRGTQPVPPFSQYLLFLFFLPSYPAGPIDSYAHFFSHWRDTLDQASVEGAVRRILLGLFKKLVLVELLFRMTRGDWFLEAVGHGTYSNHSIPILLTFGFLFFVRVYWDLAAYTDLALGTAAFFGFRLPENFSKPFFQTNLVTFWRSWHISLSDWYKNQIFFPVLGATRSPVLATYATMLGVGLWHGANWGWVLWGLWHGSGLVVSSRASGRGLSLPATPLGKMIGCVATGVFVSMGYAIHALVHKLP